MSRKRIYLLVGLGFLSLVGPAGRCPDSDRGGFTGGGFTNSANENTVTQVNAVQNVPTEGEVSEVDAARTEDGDIMVATLEDLTDTRIYRFDANFLDQPPVILEANDTRSFDTSIHTVGNFTYLVNIETPEAGVFDGGLYVLPPGGDEVIALDTSPGRTQHTTVGPGGDLVTGLYTAEGSGLVRLVDVSGGDGGQGGGPGPWRDIGEFSPEDQMGVHQDALSGAPHFRIAFTPENDFVIFWPQIFIDLTLMTVSVLDSENCLSLIGEPSLEECNPVHHILRREAQPANGSRALETDMRVVGNDVFVTYYSPISQGQSGPVLCRLNLDDGSSRCHLGPLIDDFNNRFDVPPEIKLINILDQICSLSFSEPPIVPQFGGVSQESDGMILLCSNGDTVISTFIDFALPLPSFAMAALSSAGSRIRDEFLLAVPANSLDLFVVGIFNRLTFPQFGKGAGLFSQLSLVNADAEEPALAELFFRTQEGQPLTFDRDGENLNLPGSQVPGRLEIEIPAGGRTTFQTNADGDVIVGSVIVDSNKPLAGAIVFGGEFGLAGVAASQSGGEGFSAPVETNSAEGIDTGVAVTSLSDLPVELQAQLCDSEGNVLASATPDAPLPPQGQIALFVTQLEWDSQIDFSNFRGVLKIFASGRTAGTVLQTRPGQFASLPVVPQ